MSATPKDYGWAGEHGQRDIEPVYEPDFAAHVDREPVAELVEPRPVDFAAAAEIMRGVFVYCFDVPRDKDGGPRLDLAHRKFIEVVWLLRPELLNHISLMQLSAKLGVCRATLSKAIRKFGDAYGIRNVLQKNESAREAYSQAQLRDHWRNRKKQTPAASCETTGAHADEHSENGTIHSEVPHE